MSGHFFVRKFLKEIENDRNFNFLCLNFPASILLFLPILDSLLLKLYSFTRMYCESNKIQLTPRFIC